MQTEREPQLFPCSAQTRTFAYNAQGLLSFCRGEVAAPWHCAFRLWPNWSHRASNKLESIPRRARERGRGPSRWHSPQRGFGRAARCSPDLALGGRLDLPDAFIISRPVTASCLIRRTLHLRSGFFFSFLFL